MSDFMGWSVASAIAVAVVTVAYFARAAVSGRHAVGERRSDAPTVVTQAVVMGLLVPALSVLLLSWLALAGCRLNAEFRLWAEGRESFLNAWFSFWWLLLLIDGCEFALSLVSFLRQRPFPMPRLIRNILRAVMIAGAILIVAKFTLEKDISTALASTALLTAVIGFALQGVLGNLLAGLSLHVVRSSVPGDWIAIGDMEGEVIETNWRETRLRTVGGHILIVPNSKVAESVVHNMTHPTPVRRVRISVGASYSDPPAKVIAALEASALSVSNVLREPRPCAVLTEYKDFGINYDLRFWTNQYYDRARLIGDVQSRIWYQFKRRGIEIPFPMSDKLLNDFMEVVSRQRTMPPEDLEMERMLEELRKSDFCRRLLLDEAGLPLVDDEALKPVARMMRRVFYTQGETLFKQGEVGDSAYVLVRGRIDGRVEFDADVQAHVFTVEAGALLGEMSLVSGLPRTATLSAADEVELLEIPNAAFVQLLGVRADVPAKLAELVSQRAAQNAAMFEQLKAVPKAGLKESLQRDSLLRRFRRMLSF